MVIVRIQKLILSQHAQEHAKKKHNVSVSEIESVIYSDAYEIEGYSGRKILINRVGPKIIAVIVKMEGNKLAVFTARDASDRERQGLYKYEKSKTGSKI